MSAQACNYVPEQLLQLKKGLLRVLFDKKYFVFYTLICGMKRLKKERRNCKMSHSQTSRGTGIVISKGTDTSTAK